MYNFRYIYNRYLRDDSEYCVNVSYSIRRRMSEQMNKMMNGTPNKDEIINNMQAMMHPINSQSLTIKQLTNNNNNIGDDTPSLGLKDDLSINININKEENMIECIKLLDEAMNEIFQLLSTDSLLRFAQTDAYKQIFEVKQTK